MEVRTADCVEVGRSWLKAGALNAVLSDARSRIAGNRPAVSADTIGRESIVVGIVVDAAAQRVRESLAEIAEQLGVVGRRCGGTHRTNQSGLSERRLHRSRWSFFMFLFVSGPDRERSVGRQEECDSSLGAATIATRSEAECSGAPPPNGTAMVAYTRSSAVRNRTMTPTGVSRSNCMSPYEGVG